MTNRARNSIDVVNPPEGTRLRLAGIAGIVNVSMQEMADAARISKTAAFHLVTSNVWPKKADHAAIRQSLYELFKARGANEEQLASLFHALVTGEAQRQARAGFTNPDYRGYESTPREPEDTDMLLAKQTLSPAAKRQFRVFVNPFDGDVTDDSQMFCSDEIRYVREAVMQTATGARFVAVVGESGAGKTTILEDMESRIAKEARDVIVCKPSVLGMTDHGRYGNQVRAADILAALITQLDAQASMPQTVQARHTKVERLLKQSSEAGFKHLLVLEEAHDLPEATMGHLKRLLELKLGRRPLLGILLLAQPELLGRLSIAKAKLREVVQRLEIVQLLPLDNDLQAYLTHRAKCAGRALDEFIDQSGIDELRARLTVTRPGSGSKPARAVSLLYPLAVNNLITAALNTAAELGAPIVNRDVVRAV